MGSVSSSGLACVHFHSTPLGTATASPKEGLRPPWLTDANEWGSPASTSGASHLGLPTAELVCMLRVSSPRILLRLKSLTCAT